MSVLMGLGPHSSSLLKRVAGWSEPWRDPFAMQLEQQERREARRDKAIWHAQHRAQPKKPMAPVEAEPKEKGQKRMWKWVGESIPSTDPMMLKEHMYFAEDIRKAGFKLPKLKKEVK